MNYSLGNAFKICRDLNKRYGRSYFFATQLFPRKIRNATYALYAFFRVPDEIVDTANVGSAKEKLEAWKKKWQQAYQNRQSDDAVLHATQHIFHEFKIPYQYSETFLKAMIQDTKKTRYANYQELEDYMYGSAAVVGLMMVYVIGFNQDKALAYAKELGYAMQLTNFLRDIAEDYEVRGRIYMPQNELEQFDLTADDIKTKKVSENFRKFMEFQIARARFLFSASLQGLQYLQPKGRFAVRLAAVLYSAILLKIEQQKCDVFSKRARINFLEKIWFLLKASIIRRMYYAK